MKKSALITVILILWFGAGVVWAAQDGPDNPACFWPTTAPTPSNYLTPVSVIAVPPGWYEQCFNTCFWTPTPYPTFTPHATPTETCIPSEDVDCDGDGYPDGTQVPEQSTPTGTLTVTPTPTRTPTPTPTTTPTPTPTPQVDYARIFKNSGSNSCALLIDYANPSKPLTPLGATYFYANVQKEYDWFFLSGQTLGYGSGAVINENWRICLTSKPVVNVAQIYLHYEGVAEAWGTYRSTLQHRAGVEPYATNLFNLDQTITDPDGYCISEDFLQNTTTLIPSNLWSGSRSGIMLNPNASAFDSVDCGGNDSGAQYSISAWIGGSNAQPTPTPTPSPTPTLTPYPTPTHAAVDCYSPWPDPEIEDTPWTDVIPMGEETCTTIIPGGEVGEYFTIPGVELCVTYIYLPSVDDFFPYLPAISAFAMLAIVPAFWLLRLILKQFGG